MAHAKNKHYVAGGEVRREDKFLTDHLVNITTAHYYNNARPKTRTAIYFPTIIF